MKTLQKLVIVVIIVLGVNSILIGQESDPFNYYAKYIPVNVENVSDTVYQLDLCLLKDSFDDINLLKKVQIRVGLYKGANDIFSYNFDLSLVDNLPSGLSISTTNDEIIFTIGEYTPQILHFTVMLELLDGTIYGPVHKN